MTPDRLDVSVLQAMVDTMVGIPKFSYPARQDNAPKPEGEFAHIRLLEEYPVGMPTQTVIDQDTDTTTYKTISPARLRFRVGVVDTTGLPSSKILHGWNSEVMKALMISTGYGFIKCTPLSSEDAKLEKEWEFRKGFSIELYVTREYIEVVDNITSMNISGIFYEGDTAIVLADIEINNT